MGGAAGAGAEAGQTWRHMQVSRQISADPRRSMPLGMPRATPLGANMGRQLEGSNALSNKFSSSFKPEHFL